MEARQIAARQICRFGHWGKGARTGLLAQVERGRWSITSRAGTSFRAYLREIGLDKNRAAASGVAGRDPQKPAIEVAVSGALDASGSTERRRHSARLHPFTAPYSPREKERSPVTPCPRDRHPF